MFRQPEILFGCACCSFDFDRTSTDVTHTHSWRHRCDNTNAKIFSIHLNWEFVPTFEGYTRICELSSLARNNVGFPNIMGSCTKSFLATNIVLLPRFDSLWFSLSLPQLTCELSGDMFARCTVTFNCIWWYVAFDSMGMEKKTKKEWKWRKKK